MSKASLVLLEEVRTARRLADIARDRARRETNAELVAKLKRHAEEWERRAAELERRVADLRETTVQARSLLDELKQLNEQADRIQGKPIKK